MVENVEFSLKYQVHGSLIRVAAKRPHESEAVSEKARDHGEMQPMKVIYVKNG